MRKTLVFDMDGTIADLYGVNGWLENLREENARPYIEAKPLYDMDVLASILGLLRLNGWTIAITSWLSKETPLFPAISRRSVSVPIFSAPLRMSCSLSALLSLN